MSHEENTKFLEEQQQRAEQAIVENDAQALSDVYLTLEENGFSSEAEDLRKQFGILSE